MARVKFDFHADRGEVGYRLGRLLYRVIAFCVLALSITGGHIAHVHGRAVLYFVGLWPHVPKGSNQWLVINKNASNPDEKYWLSAAVDLAILAARTRRRRPPHAIAATLTVARRRRSSSSSSGRRSRSGARASSGAPRAPRSPSTSRAASAARSEYIDAPSSHYDELESGARSPVNT